LHYYYLTGDETARDAVLSLGNWVIAMDENSRQPFGSIDRRPTGLASSTASPSYHGPGRGAGNSISALIDAFALTRNDRYSAKAEQLIRRCIHPRDDISARGLNDPECRWSYLVFLQVLGKYLDWKLEQGDLDFMYAYAQASLLHYADWMLEHEVPYATMLNIVEIPTKHGRLRIFGSVWCFIWPPNMRPARNAKLFGAKRSIFSMFASGIYAHFPRVPSQGRWSCC
jgi:hypothetical protein